MAAWRRQWEGAEIKHQCDPRGGKVTNYRLLKKSNYTADAAHSMNSPDFRAHKPLNAIPDSGEPFTSTDIPHKYGLMSSLSCHLPL